MMLKYLPITALAAIVNLVLVATNSSQIASAQIAPTRSISADRHQKLITKDEIPTHINSQQKSDIKGIHRALTQYYRGFNEYSIERMERATVPGSITEAGYLRDFFSRLRSAGVAVSVEVENIELVSLSENNALVNIDQVMKMRGSQRSATSKQAATIALVKYRGQWRISDGNTVIKSLDRDR
jgi:excinuclease UvrABC nuclease subunit